ncbi:MAG: (2Fe-2S)-binding protein [Denitromonas halophila]|nr:MAG: (2Fe-2S)-binding protein [Denitromonas halophila]
MARITFIESNGATHTADINDGTSLMEGATGHNVPGIDADCGGAMSCGTCLVHIDPAWVERTGTRCEHEQQMLEFAGRDGDNARLSCQIIVDATLDGLVVRLPEAQI